MVGGLEGEAKLAPPVTVVVGLAGLAVDPVNPSPPAGAAVDVVVLEDFAGDPNIPVDAVVVPNPK